MKYFITTILLVLTISVSLFSNTPTRLVSMCDTITGEKIMVEWVNDIQDCCFEWTGTDWEKRKKNDGSPDCDNLGLCNPSKVSLVQMVRTCISGQPKYIHVYSDGSRTIENPSSTEDDWCTDVGSQSQVEVDKSYYIQSTLSPVDIHDNGSLVQISADNRVAATWERTANEYTYNAIDNADVVKISVNIKAIDAGASNYWAKPQLRVFKNNTIIANFGDLAMQQNTAYSGDILLPGYHVDVSAQTGDVYRFEWYDNDNRIATLIPTIESTITLEAIEKVIVSGL